MEETQKEKRKAFLKEAIYEKELKKKESQKETA